MVNRRLGAADFVSGRSSLIRRLSQAAVQSTLIAGGTLWWSHGSAIAACAPAVPVNTQTCDATPLAVPIDIVTNVDFSLILNDTDVSAANDATSDAVISLIVTGGDGEDATLQNLSNNLDSGISVNSTGGNGVGGPGAAIVLRSLSGDVVVGTQDTGAVNPFSFGPANLPTALRINAITVPAGPGAPLSDDAGMRLQAGNLNSGSNGDVIAAIVGGTIDVQNAIGLDVDSRNGDILLDVGTDISSGFRGIFAQSTDAGNIGTVIQAGTTISGTQLGVFTETDTGSNNVINNGGVSGSTAILATSVGGGAVSVTGNGALTATGLGGAGIGASALQGGAVNVDYDGAITSAHNGVSAQSLVNTGAVRVDVSGAVRATDNGVFASSEFSDVTVVTSNNVSAGTNSTVVSQDGTGYGVNVEVGANSVGTITNNGILEGGGAAILATLEDTADQGKSLVINNNASIRNLSFGGVNTAIVIDGDFTDGATINNASNILGSIVSRGNTADTLVNKGTWTTMKSDFGAGDDVLLNSGFLQLSAVKTAVVTRANGFALPPTLNGIIDFGAGNDLFDNTGTLKVVGGNAHLRNLETFNNGAGGLIDMRDGETDDALYIDGVFKSGGALGIDVALDTGSSDRLIAGIIEADADGPTQLLIDLQGKAVKAGDEIVVIEADNGAAIPAGAFSSPSITSGPFTLDLTQNGTGSIVLRTTGGAAPPAIVQPQIPVENTITNVPTDHAASQIEKPGQPTVDAGAYVQIVGSTESRDIEGSYSGAGAPGGLTFEDNYDMEVFGLVAGIDRMRKTAYDDGTRVAWVVGGFGGLVNANVDFETSPNTQEMFGGVVGAYYALAYNQFRLHALVKTDFGTSKVSTGSDKDKSGYFVPGFAINTGYRFNFGKTSYFQPIATVSYANASTGDLDLDGNHIEYDNTESLRGRLGLRVASFVEGETHVMEPWIQASLWHEFDGKAAASFTGASGALDFAGTGAGTFGEIGVGANLLNKKGTGFSGNFRSDVSFGEQDLIGLSAKLGVEYRFPVK
jgi:Autotransporter beta-domain